MKSDPNPLEGLRVLLVDDNAQALALTRMMLEDIGVTQVATACGGGNALKLILDAGAGVDVILSDWNMPGVSGLDLLKKIRLDYPDLPFVMMSGRGDDEAASSARAHNVTSFLVKPFDADGLKRKLGVVARILRSQTAPA